MPRVKYVKIIEDLKAQIASGELTPGDRIVSIREMCNEYGVSSIVALRVFRELAEEGLIEKRDGEGYYVRSMESDDSSDTIVCAFRAPQNINLRDNFGNRILCGILAGAFSLHKHVVMPEASLSLRDCKILSDEKAKELADEVFSVPNPAGVILDFRVTDESIQKYFLPRAGRIPLVLAGRTTQLSVKTVYLPMETIGMEVARLAQMSAVSSFILLSARPSVFLDAGALDRALLKGLNMNPADVFITYDFIQVSEKRDGEIADIAAERIAAARGKTFVFCPSDGIAELFCDHMTARGLTASRDYRLMGFGGLECAELHNPKLSTIAIDQEAVGASAVELLFGRLQNSIAATYTIKLRETF